MSSWSIPMQQYRSLTPGMRPASLAAGQLFLNQADGVLCWPNVAGLVKTVSLTNTSGSSIAPTPPAVGAVAHGYTQWAKREMLATRGAATTLTPIQPHLGLTRVRQWSGTEYATAPVASLAAPMVVVGTGTLRNGFASATSFASQSQRVGQVSAATAGALAAFYSTTSLVSLGYGGTPSGFFASFTFMAADAATVAGARQFVGLAATSAPTNIEPSTHTKMIGVGHGAADTNLKLYCCGSAVQPPIDLGANFPANTLSADVYTLTLFSDTNAGINWQVDRNGGASSSYPNAFSASGTFANLTPGTTAPFQTALLAPTLWRSNNATALAVGLDLIHVAIMTDGY